MALNEVGQEINILCGLSYLSARGHLAGLAEQDSHWSPMFPALLLEVDLAWHTGQEQAGTGRSSLCPWKGEHGLPDTLSRKLLTSTLHRHE